MRSMSSVFSLAVVQANDNAGVAAANQIVGFFEKGTCRAQQSRDTLQKARPAISTHEIIGKKMETSLIYWGYTCIKGNKMQTIIL